MIVADGRGENKKLLKKKNKASVAKWFENNPGSTKTECSRALVLSYPTVLKLVKEIVAENKRAEIIEK